MVSSFWTSYSLCLERQGWFDRALAEAQVSTAEPERHRPEIFASGKPGLLPQGRQIVLVSYATQEFRKNQHALSRSALSTGSMDEAVLWTREDLEKTQFHHQHPTILSLKRGDGAWSWKPFIILNEMRLRADGDYIVYHDSGRGKPY